MLEKKIKVETNELKYKNKIKEKIKNKKNKKQNNKLK